MCFPCNNNCYFSSVGGGCRVASSFYVTAVFEALHGEKSESGKYWDS